MAVIDFCSELMTAGLVYELAEFYCFRYFPVILTLLAVKYKVLLIELVINRLQRNEEEKG